MNTALSHAPQIISSGLVKRDGSRPRISQPIIPCGYCKTPFRIFRRTRKFCSPVCAGKARAEKYPEATKRFGEKMNPYRQLAKGPPVQICLQCAGEFKEWNCRKQQFCSQKCAADHRAATGTVTKPTDAHKAELSKRMTQNNPMKKEAARRKMKVSLMGRTFLSRGGNGKFTKQQQALATAMNLPMEHAIPTTLAARMKFTSLPNHYKVDIADTTVMLAIEVDGNTHKQKKWKFLDRRKTKVLEFLGWSVLRFWNQEVDDNLPKVVETIRSTILKLKERTAISQTES